MQPSISQIYLFTDFPSHSHSHLVTEHRWANTALHKYKYRKCSNRSGKAELLSLQKRCRPAPKASLWQITLSWRERRRCGFMTNFHLSLEQFKFGALPVIRVIARNNFLWPVNSTGQTSNYQTSALTILWMTCLRLKPRAPSLFLGSEDILTSFSHCFWTPHVLGSLTFSSMWSSHLHECN